jgi:hypothetical protein
MMTASWQRRGCSTHVRLAQTGLDWAELVADIEVGHLDHGDCWTTFCTLEGIDAWLRLGSRLFTSLTAALNSLCDWCVSVAFTTSDFPHTTHRSGSY